MNIWIVKYSIVGNAYFEAKAFMTQALAQAHVRSFLWDKLTDQIQFEHPKGEHIAEDMKHLLEDWNVSEAIDLFNDYMSDKPLHEAQYIFIDEVKVEGVGNFILCPEQRKPEEISIDDIDNVGACSTKAVDESGLLTGIDWDKEVDIQSVQLCNESKLLTVDEIDWDVYHGFKKVSVRKAK